MIIVSQDEDRIFNFANIIYITVNEKNEIVATTNWNDNADGAYELGKYKTEERAKEVLQEIIERYKKIKSKEPYHYERGNGTKSYCINRIKVLRSRLLEMQKEIEEYYK